MHRFNAMRQQAMMKIHFESGPSNLKNCADKSKVLIMIIETDSRPRLTLPCTAACPSLAASRVGTINGVLVRNLNQEFSIYKINRSQSSCRKNCR